MHLRGGARSQGKTDATRRTAPIGLSRAEAYRGLPMKRFLYPVFCLIVFAVVDVARVHAQFVHFQFKSRFTLFEARGYKAGYPWDTNGMLSGIPVTFDIYYDASTPEVSAGSGRFVFNDPSKNYFHVSANLADYALTLPAINITRPIDSITVFDTGFDLTFFNEKPSEALDFDIVYARPQPFTGTLPIPSLPELLINDFGSPDSGFTLDGVQDMFRLPNPGFGFLSGTLELSQEGIHSEFPPVPEPSTYGLGGLAVMAAAIAWRHRRKQGIPATTALPD